MGGEWRLGQYRVPIARWRSLSGLLVVLVLVANAQGRGLYWQGATGAPSFSDIWSLITGNLGVIFLFMAGAYAILRDKPFLVPGWVHRNSEEQAKREYERMVEQKDKELEGLRHDRDEWRDIALERGQTASGAVEDAERATKLARTTTRAHKPATPGRAAN